MTRTYTIQDLAQSNIDFIEQTHEYLFIPKDSVEPIRYHGITGIINPVLFADKYSEVDPDVLAKAAERGTAIHRLCQATDGYGDADAQDLALYATERDNYLSIKESNGIKMIANEYLISYDDLLIASQIDCVDEKLNLYDIKTTSLLDVDYVSWQLSFYAWLFEVQNPNLKAGKLYAIWLRGDKSKLVEVHRHTPEECQEVVKAWQAGVTLSSHSTAPIEDQDVSSLIKAQRSIQEHKSIIRLIEASIQDVEARLLERMTTDCTKQVSTSDGIIITRVAPIESKRINTKKLESMHSDIYAECIETSTRAGYLKYTFPKEELPF